MSTKHTPGPWKLVEMENWPFDLLVVAKNDDQVICSRRFAHSTVQKTVADCAAAVGFSGEERERVVEILSRQLHDHRLIAAAPDLLEALKACVKCIEDLQNEEPTPISFILDDAEKAIKKAEEGKTP